MRSQHSVLICLVILRTWQEEGTSCMILLKEKTDVSAFRERFESTELPTVTGPGYYKLQTLQESYFDTKLADSVKTFSHRQIALLSIGLLSAFLVLFIACFNYVNLSFSAPAETSKHDSCRDIDGSFSFIYLPATFY